MVALILSRTPPRPRPYHKIHNNEQGEKPKGGGKPKGKRSLLKENVTSPIDYLFWDSFLESKYEFKVYFFELKNPDQVMKSKLPKISQKGPYVYDVHRRWDLNNDDPKNDEITFRENSIYKFNKSASGKLGEQDNVTLLGAPYLNVLVWTKAWWPLKMFHQKISSLLPDYLETKEPIVLRTSVRNLLFDGVPLCTPSKRHFVIRMMCEKLIRQTRLSLHHFMRVKKDGLLYSIFYHKNNTYQGTFTVKKGLLNGYEAGLMTRYNSLRFMKIWNRNERECNIVKGFLNHFPPNSTHTTILEIFLEEICRTVKLEFTGTEVVHGILGYRYASIKSTFSNTGENVCFCIKKAVNLDREQNCLYNGVLDASNCLGSPIVISFPHFLHADARYTELIEGLKPNKPYHEIYITVEPETGILLKVVKRLQFNMFLHQDIQMATLTEVHPALVPLFWVEESYILPEKYADTIIGEDKRRHWRTIEIVKYVLLTIACIAAVVGVALLGFVLLRIYL